MRLPYGSRDRSARRRLRRTLQRYPLAIVGLAVVLGLLLLSAAGVFILPDPSAMNPPQRLRAPSLEHLFGTDNLGRELVSRTAHGTQVTVLIATGSVMLALLLGVPLGVIAGYRGGRTDNVIMRLLDILFAFPAILLALTIISVLGPSATNLVLTIGLVYSPHFARIVRGPVLSIKAWEFVEASRATGAGTLRIMARHVLPNAMAPVIVQTTVSLSTAILAEAALSFLGLGPQPPTPSLGAMISSSRSYMETAWWLAFFPGMVIALLVGGINLLGDGLRDLLDPRLAVRAEA